MLPRWAVGSQCNNATPCSLRPSGRCAASAATEEPGDQAAAGRWRQGFVANSGRVGSDVCEQVPDVGQALGRAGLSVFPAAHFCKEAGEVGAEKLHPWVMVRQAGFHNRYGAAEERFGLGLAVGGVKERGQIVEIAGNAGVIGAVSRLVDGEGATNIGFVIRKRPLRS